MDFSSTAAPSIPEYRTANLTSVVSGIGSDATEQSNHNNLEIFICILYKKVQIFNVWFFL